MKYPLRSITLSLSGLLIFFPGLGFSQSQPAMIEPSQAFPLTPRITGLGMAGDDEVVWGDMMLPLIGNANQVWYVDVQGKTAFDTDWLGSAGTGVRQVVNGSSILGAYVFVDRTISPESNSFWFVSPGIEELGTWFDFRANGYFPTNTKKQYGATDWADNFGIYDYVSFQGHEQLDILMVQDEEVGWGGDVEIGSKIPGLNGTRAYVGGYHFSFDTASDINGVEGRVELPVNRNLGLTVRDSYDNEQHNTILVGLKITLGGVNAHPTNLHQAIQERILDPIERNLATLGQGVGEPVQDILTPVANSNPLPPMVERNNIWFFSPTGTDTFSGIEDCTMENVCVNTNFTQATIEGINSLKASSPNINNYRSTSPSFFLAPGNYSSLDGNTPLQFTNDWIWGRSADFVAEEQNAILTGAMIFNGNNNLLNSIILQSDGMHDVAIRLKPASYLNIEASKIGANAAGTSYHTAIEVNAASLRIADFLGVRSEIIAYGNDDQPVTGITATSGSVITMLNSDLFASNVQDENLGSAERNVATGFAINGSNLNILNSKVEATAEITGDNSGYNMASAIGANAVGENVSFQGNNVTIGGSTTEINANALIRQNNFGGANMAVGIGENLIDTSGPALFTGNTISVDTGSHINSSALISKDNQSANSRNANNMAAGIGTNGVDASNAMTMNNTLTLNDMTLMSLAQVQEMDVNVGEVTANNMATGLGGNAVSKNNSSVANTSFQGNTIKVENSSMITGRAVVIEDNRANNFATGIGGNAFLATSRFDSNMVMNINDSTVNGEAVVGVVNTNNLAVGLGGNAFIGAANSSFTNNGITIENSSTVRGVASLLENNVISSGNNLAVGIGGNALFGGIVNFTGNSAMSIDHSFIFGESTITGNNLMGLNFASGLGSNSIAGSAVFSGNTNISISEDSTVTGHASVGNNNASGSYNLAVGIGDNNSGMMSIGGFSNNGISIDDSQITGEASVVNNNNGNNMAVGLGANTVASAVTSFATNMISIANLSAVKGTTSMQNNSSNDNFAVGLGGNAEDGGVIGFTDTNIISNDSSIIGEASVSNNNNGRNYATGLGGNVDDATINFTGNSSIMVSGVGSGAIGIRANAVVEAFNNDQNLATGVGGNISTSGGFVNLSNAMGLTISNSNLTARAIAGANLGDDIAHGLSLSTGTMAVTINTTNVFARANLTIPNLGANYEAVGLYSDAGLVTMNSGSITATQADPLISLGSCTSGSATFSPPGLPGVNTTNCIP